jgi:dTDP-4-amino-4,6-dideoxygalactose transaminase
MLPPIPFLDLAALHAPLASEMEAAYKRVVSASQFILGPELEAFEGEFAAYCGACHCIGTGNGLDALTLTLIGAGLAPGDEVIVPAQTFIATWMAVSHAGATPVPVDIAPATHNIDPELIEAAITPRTRAIIPVHLFGRPAEMDAIDAVARHHGLFVLEDAAQAHGATYRGKRAGNLGHAAAFSFYPGKNLGALGDGGAVITDDDALADRLRGLRNYGSPRKFHHPEIGFNSRLDELQAAFLRAKLPHLDHWNARREAIAGHYDTALHGLPLGLPLAADSNCQPVWHQYVVTTPQRDRLQVQLAEQGIATMVHYPLPPHRQPAYNELAERSFPAAEALAADCLSLPICPTLTTADVERIAVAIRLSLQSQ